MQARGMQVHVHMMTLPNKPLSAQHRARFCISLDGLSSHVRIAYIPKCKALHISTHVKALSKNHVHFTDGRK